MKSFVALALCLSLILTFATARIPHSYRQLQERNEQPKSPNAVVAWLNRLLERRQNTVATAAGEEPANDVCYLDEYYKFVNGSTFGKTVCQGLGVKYPNRTSTVDFTPIETVTIVQTIFETQDVLERTTPVTTITTTVTAPGLAKRDPQITPEAYHVDRNVYIQAFRRQAENETALPEDDNEIAQSLSSACKCQTYIATTLTETYTNQPDYVTLFGDVRATTTVVSTRTAKEMTSVVTVTVPAETTRAGSESPSAGPTAPGVTTSAGGASQADESSKESSAFVQTTGVSPGTPSSEEPTATDDEGEPTSTDDEPTTTGSGLPSIPDPTAPPFTCPDDDGQLISQMLGSERFDYDIFCDTDLPDSPDISPDLLLSYGTLAECVAACSYANAQFEQPVCQGAVYLGSTTDETNCVLKSGANVNDSVPEPGVNIAILRRIAVGLDENNVNGTNTQSISFSSETPTMDPVKVGYGIVSALGNSTASMPIITPPPGQVISGRPNLNGVTAYSTYVSDGTTFSTGSAFSTYVSTNGSWYSAYYSTFQLAWTNAQTIFAAGETTFPIAYNDTGVTEEHNGANGEYSVITKENVTSIDDQGNQIVYNSTVITKNNTFNADNVEIFATTTTDYYIYTQAVESGASGSMGNSGAGIITSSVSSFSTQTIILSSGFTGGGSGIFASGAIQTPPPVFNSTSMISTQTVVLSSGGLGGEEGASGGGAGGETAPITTVTSTSAFSTQTVILSSGALGGEEGGEGSGGAGSTAPINGTSGVGTAPITSTSTGTTVILSTGGTGGAFSTAASGSGSGGETSGLTSTAASGQIMPSTSTGTFTNSGDDRTPGGDSTTGGTSTEASGEATPSSSTRTFSFTNPSGPRSPGTESSSTPFPATGSTPSVPTQYLPPVSTGPSVGIPPPNSSFPVPTGTGSTISGTGPAPYPPLETSPPSNETLPAPTSSRSFSWTNSLDSRSGTLASSSSTLTGTGPVPYPPLSTTPSNDTVPVPTGTAPSGSIPTGHPSNQTVPVPTGTAPSETSSSRTFTFSQPTGPRAGTVSTTSTVSITSRRPLQVVQTLPLPPRSSTLGASISLSTGGPSNSTQSNTISLSTSLPTNSTTLPFPTAPPVTSCPPQNISTTTLWQTTTLLGCFEQCKNGWGGYGPGGKDGYTGPQSFGPPAAIFASPLSGDPNPPQTTSPAAATSS